MSDIEKIKKLHQKGHYKKAIDGYQKLIKKEPNNDEAYFGMALAYKELKHFKEALQHTKSALKLEPNAERYLQFQGQLYLALSETENAYQSFKQSLKLNPNLYFSYLALGDIHLIQSEFIKAEENYRLALRVHQDGVPATLKLVRLMILTGRLDEAESELHTAAFYKPEDLDLKLNQGIIKLETGEFGYAELHFKKLLEDHPDYPLAKAFLAISLMDSDLKQAQKHISELIEAERQSPELMAATGMLCLKNKHYDEAIKYLVPVCRGPMAYPIWLMALCQAWIAIGEVNVAKETLQHLLQRGHNDRAAIMLGKVYIRNQDDNQAAELFADIEADSRYYQSALAQLQVAYFRLQRWQDALETTEKLLALNENHSEAIFIKVHALVQLQKNDAALAILNSAIENPDLAEKQADFFLYSGLLKDAKKLYDEAWQDFEQQLKPAAKDSDRLTKSQEKTVQKWPSAEPKSSPVFAFTDNTTGHRAFIDWLNQQDITALIDRFTAQGRSDLFQRNWRFEDIDALSETRSHLLRKKYRQHLNSMDQKGVSVDFIPFTVLNMTLIKKIFPAATVIILDRNFADRQLHHHVFKNSQFKPGDFNTLKNQMIAMNPNIKLVDIDALLAHEDTLMKPLSSLFNQSLSAYQAPEKSPLSQLLLPKDHWKNYHNHIKPKA